MDKFFNEYSSICSKIYRSRIKELWDFGKEGIIPEGEDARLLEVLKEHREYYKVWGIADTIDEPGYTIKGVNPFLHVAAHLIIENQLAEENPKEVREILKQLEEAGADRHDAIHLIANPVMEQVFYTMKHKRPFDEQKYVSDLRRIVNDYKT
jgi:MoaA/NifB/PqqE/SkfB family radical SAM enzyme